MAVIKSLLLATLAQVASAQITVNVNQTFQTIRGLGYSEAFQRSQWVYNTMSTELQQEMFDLLHDPVTGAGFSILRIGIGSSANSSNDWMNSIEPESPGLNTSTATYEWNGNDSSQVWWAKEVQKRGVDLFYGNSWGADAYMKTNNSTDNGGYLCGTGNTTECETGDWRQQYSDKLAQWVKYYAEEGINITHLGPLNEPDISVSDFQRIMLPACVVLLMGHESLVPMEQLLILRTGDVRVDAGRWVPEHGHPGCPKAYPRKCRSR
jgi:O-glycosyl hydrolase